MNERVFNQQHWYLTSSGQYGTKLSYTCYIWSDHSVNSTDSLDL